VAGAQESSTSRESVPAVIEPRTPEMNGLWIARPLSKGSGICMYSIERVDLPCVETTREAFFFVTPTGDSPRDPRVSLTHAFKTSVAGMDHGPAGLPSHVSWFRGGTKNLQYHPNEVSFSLPWRPGAPAPAAPWSFFSPRGLLQAFSRYRFRLALLLRFKNTGGAGTHRTPVKRHRGEPGLTGSNSAVAPVVASVVLTFTRYTRSAVLVVGSFEWRNARV
jgi:hypothetical protein